MSTCYMIATPSFRQNWMNLKAIGAAGVEESAAQSQSKFHLRARDWDDSKRMFGLAHSAFRNASTAGAEIMGRALVRMERPGPLRYAVGIRCDSS